MFLFFFLLYITHSQSYAINTFCQTSPLCFLTDNATTVICDKQYAIDNDTSLYPIVSCFPPVKTYSFRNFVRIQTHTFESIIFPENESLTIKLINISTIESEAFSTSMIIPINSKLSIEIEHMNNSSSMTINSNAFNRIRIDHLKFTNINNFNGRQTFDTECFGNDLDINYLIFENCDIKGFSNVNRKVADVNHLVIRESSSLTQLTSRSLPSFLSTTKTLEISNTGLSIIDSHTFQAWSLILEELIIVNNSNLNLLPPAIVDGTLMKLNKVDLSYNKIKYLQPNYNWFAYSYTKQLILRSQQIDLFLKTNILKNLPFLQALDLSHGFINETDDDFMKTYFNTTPRLTSIDLSYTNLTEYMIIDILTHLSQTASDITNVRLFGHRLADKNFCRYFAIFKSQPNLLKLHLNDDHECNCVVDLFFTNQFSYDSADKPKCLLNSTRKHCNITTQLSISTCSNTHILNQSNQNDKTGNYAFTAIITSTTISVFVLLLVGGTVAYRIRRRRNTDLNMEFPIENPLTVVIESRSQSN